MLAAAPKFYADLALLMIIDTPGAKLYNRFEIDAETSVEDLACTPETDSRRLGPTRPKPRS